MSEHDNTGHARIRHRWVQQEGGNGFPRETQPRTQMAAGDSIEADMLADMATFIQAPPEQYPPFDIQKFLRELPAVVPNNSPAQSEDVARQPRLANQQSNIHSTGLVGIVQQVRERGIDLPGPEPPRNAGQKHDDWDARFEEFKRQMEEHGIVNMSEFDPSGNTDQEADGHGIQAISFHVRTVKDAGIHILPETRWPSTAHEREEILGRRAANRRHVALRERDLYTTIMARGVHLPRSENPMDELLDHGQDQALFGWLQGHNAFRDLALNEAYRVERGGPQAGHTRTNREIYDMLRDCGIFWEMQNDGTGRWRTRERYLFDEEEEDISDTFQELLLEGALADPGIRRLFPGRDDYTIFRKLPTTDEGHLGFSTASVATSLFADGEPSRGGMRVV